MSLLVIEGLVAGYSPEVDIIDDVHLVVEDGTMVSIIGPNGAGKSTLLKAIFGLIRVPAGSVLFDGEELIGKRADEILRLGACFVPQGRNVFTEMTVEENLELGGYVRRDQKALKQDMVSVYERFPVLADRRKQKAGHLSGGEQQMLEMGRALLISPRLLLLDEPSMGLSPKLSHEVFQKIREVKASGAAVLIVEQNADASLKMSDHAYVLDQGRNRIDGPAAEMLVDESVRAAYLGL